MLFGKASNFVKSIYAPITFKEEYLKLYGDSEIDSIWYVSRFLERLFGYGWGCYIESWEQLEDKEIRQVVIAMVRFLASAVYECRRIEQREDFLYVEQEVFR